ncbi:MAG: ATP-binding protein, partial [Acidimicrobiia bacterium]|nr:ATP-binding protein [Acidimicrobiia bacterium]
IELTAVSSVRCLGDPVRVRQILRNLIANALRYGGPHIRITFGSDGSGGHVFVTDDGEGGPEGHHISRTLARLMGGDLIYRRQGSDTIFQLTLRLIDT